MPGKIATIYPENFRNSEICLQKHGFLPESLQRVAHSGTFLQDLTAESCLLRAAGGPFAKMRAETSHIRTG